MTELSGSCLPSAQVHVEQELLIYEAFPYDQQQPQNNLKVRFKKVRALRGGGVEDAGLQGALWSCPGAPQHQLQGEEVEAEEG